MIKEYVCKIIVRGYELDSFGHVNHAVYLNYLEFARWEMLREEGIDLPRLEALQRWPVIVHIEAKYMKAAFMGEELAVRTHAIERTRASLVFEQVITRGDTPIFKAKVVSVTINEVGKATEVPPIFIDFWEKSQGNSR